MLGFIWVFVVGALVAAVANQVIWTESEPLQRFVLAYPVFAVWAIWAVGYLLGKKRRAVTLAVLGRVSYRLRSWRVSVRRRRRLRGNQ